MTDQTESEHAELLADLAISENYGNHTARLAIAAIRALEAKGREKDREIEVREADNREVIVDLRQHCDRLESANRGLAAEVTRLNAAGRELSRQCDSQAQEIGVLRPERDRLAGEVERLRAEQPTREDMDDISEAGRLMASAAKKIMGLSAEVARLTSELAAARENEARWRWMFPADPLISVTERMQRVYRKWDGSDSWNDAVDAARRAGEGEA